MLNNIDYQNRIERKNKFNLVLCEIYNKYIHGDFEENDTYYLTLYKFNFDLNHKEDENESNINDDYYTNLYQLQDLAKYFKKKYKKIKNRSDYCFISNHSVIRNYQQMIESPNYFKPEIGECIYLDNGINICILKTFWIRIIQRAWKKVFLKRQNICIKRMSYSSILYREMHGNWPKSCEIMPGLKGLLFVK
jgi:hypothetical protein